jgi:signal transduction histidine kinase
MIIILRDLTEEHKIQQARQMITDTLIHDLRSPISAVMSALDVLGDAPGLSGTEDELVAQAMKVAQRSTERVYNLVNSLLEIARLQSGDLELNRGPLKLGELTAQVVKDFSMQADEFGVRLENHIPLDLPPVNADRSKIERVLFNLVDNALKFAPAGGEIRLNALLEAGERVIIQISDNGPGIPEDYREKIFDRFSQVPGRRGRTRGTGLGLAFCKLALDAHGERIWVEPASPEGSTFAFSLPVHHSPATLAAPAEPPLGG